MRLRHIMTMILIVIAIGSVALLGYLLTRMCAPPELEAMCSSIQIVILVFSAAAGMLALMRYWNSVEARIEQQRWDKLRHLETSFENFRNRNVNVIQAFEWSHLLRAKYLPLCLKALAYDEADDESRSNMLTTQEMATIRELDDFLEYFEGLYFAVSRRLVKVEDLFIFLGYYVNILDEAYCDTDDDRLKKYITEYYSNIRMLLDICKNKRGITLKPVQRKARGNVPGST